MWLVSANDLTGRRKAVPIFSMIAGEGIGYPRCAVMNDAICAPPTHLRVHSRVQSAPVDALLGCAYAQRLAAVVISPRPSHTRRTILDCDTNARCTRPDASVALGIMRHRADRAGL